MRFHDSMVHYTVGLLAFGALLIGCAPNSAPPAVSQTTNVSDQKEAPEVHVTNRPITNDATFGGEMVSIEAIHPAEVPVGSSYQYELKVTNNTDDKMFHGVVVKQQLGEGFTIEKSEPELQGDHELEASWNLVSLKPGETKVIRVSAASDVEGTAQLCLAVDYTPAVCIATKFVKPEIQIVKQAPSEGNVCLPILVKYTVRNTGSGAAENVVLVDNLEDGLTTVAGEEQVRQEMGTIPPGEAREVEVQLKSAKTGDFGSRAAAIVGEKEVRSNSVNTTFRAAELELAFAGPDAEYVNRPMPYRLTVKNVGDAIAENGRVTVTLPPGVDVIRIDEPELATAKEPAAEEVAEKIAGALAASQLDETHLQWQLGDFAPGQEATMRFTAVSHTGQELKYAAAATFVCAGAQEDEVAATATTRTDIIALPALLVFAVDNEDPIRINSEVVYSIGVLNQGDAPDSNIAVIATLPEQLEFVEATGPTKATAEGKKITFEKLKELPAGERVTWQVRAKANKEGDVRLKVETTSDAFTKAVRSEEPTRLFKVD